MFYVLFNNKLKEFCFDFFNFIYVEKFFFKVVLNEELFEILKFNKLLLFEGCGI